MGRIVIIHRFFYVMTGWNFINTVIDKCFRAVVLSALKTFKKRKKTSVRKRYAKSQRACLAGNEELGSNKEDLRVCYTRLRK